MEFFVRDESLQKDYVFLAPQNSFLLQYEIQSTGTVTEGAVPFTPFHACAERDYGTVPFWGSPLWGGAGAGGMKHP